MDAYNHVGGNTYDAAGEMTNDGFTTYTYDAEGRMTAVVGSTTYTLDGDGKRVKKSTGTLYWYGASGSVLAETDTSGNTTNEYIFFAGGKARRDGSGNVYYYFGDQIGSSRTITNATGSLCYDADVYPFGGERPPYVNTCAQNYKFAGMERDAETGNDHTQFRQYMYNYGPWASPDPMGGDVTNPQSLNRYAYVMDNPTSLIDPFGLSCVHTDDGNTADDGDGKGCAAAGVNPDGTFTVPGQQVDVPGAEGPDVQPIYAGSNAGLTFGSTGGSVGAGGGHGGGGGKGGVLRSTKINLCKALQRARLVAQAGLSVGVVYVKIQGAEVAFAAAPATGGASAVVTGYLMIGAGGNAFSAGAQLRGAFSGDIAGADEAASLITTSTTATGLLALAISGNRETAAWWGGFESLATTGVNGGMTGHLIDESLRGAAKLVDMSDKAQNVLDFLGVDPGCGGG